MDVPSRSNSPFQYMATISSTGRSLLPSVGVINGVFQGSKVAPLKKPCAQYARAVILKISVRLLACTDSGDVSMVTHGEMRTALENRPSISRGDTRGFGWPRCRIRLSRRRMPAESPIKVMPDGNSFSE